jgi:exodeoxyribonuclease VIII
MKLPHVMLDLETMGRGPDAAIAAIGAVEFGLTDSGAEVLGRSFYRVVDLASSVHHGGVMDAETVLWWLGQSEAARRELIDRQAVDLPVALQEFACFLGAAGTGQHLWGNGAAFDNVILRRSYERLDIPAPWQYWDDRCFRTIRAENRHVPAPERRGTHHNALDDAMHQARHLMAIWQRRSSVAALQAVQAGDFEPEETHS